MDAIDAYPFTSDPDVVDGTPRESDRAVDFTLAAMSATLDGALAGISDAREILCALQAVDARDDVESGQKSRGEITLDLYLAHAAADLRTALSLLRDQSAFLKGAIETLPIT